MSEHTTTAITEPEHWGPDILVGCLDPDQELETIEVGDRVAWGLTVWMGVSAYGAAGDRERSATVVLVGQVAEATSHRGHRFPAEWWPSDAGPLPEHDGSGEANRG